MSRRSPYVMTYRRTHDFPLARAELWRQFGRIDMYERWWPWIRNPRVDGEGIQAGSLLTFGIVTPLPYRMCVEAAFTEVSEGEKVEAELRRDLRGVASLVLEEGGHGTLAHVSWEIEVMQRPMRAATRVARPIVERAHAWGARVALDGFRRHVVDEGRRGF